MMRNLLLFFATLLLADSSFGYDLAAEHEHRVRQEHAKDIVLAMIRNPRGAAAGAGGPGPCPATSGPLSLIVTSPRTSGISPLTVWVDATGTTDSTVAGNTSVFQDVQFGHNYGDAGVVSGSGAVWQNGSNAGLNSRNLSTGAIGAHMYYVVPGGGNHQFTDTITASDGVNTASCTVSFTVFDPLGANGFTKTTCIAASTTPVAGVGGCPASAAAGTIAVLQQSALATALSTCMGNGQQCLFKCGDTFTGDQVLIGTVVGWTIGAYGSADCSNTQTNRPIFQYSGASGSGDGILLMGFGNNRPGDGRLIDIDMEGNALAAQNCTNMTGNVTIIPYQITHYNLLCNAARANFYWSHAAQMSLINSVGVNMQGAIGTFINVDGNGTGVWSGTPISNLNYQALIGNRLSGTGDTGGGGDEAVRISACMLCVFANNTFKDGNTVGATFKLFESNNFGAGGSQINFAGIPVQYVMIEDNLFTGKSGALLSEIGPQNVCNDERFLDIVVERNLFQEQLDNLGDLLIVSGERETIRDNAFFIGSGFVHPSFFNVQIGARNFNTGAPGNGCPSNPTSFQVTQFTEVYNNIGYALSFHSVQNFIAFDNAGLGGAAGANSIVKNNLYYSPLGAAVVVDNLGTGNTVSNNTSNANSVNNPSVTNASGTFNFMSDFKPTANFSGGVAVPVLTDGVNVPWSPTWDLGAVKH